MGQIFRGVVCAGSALILAWGCSASDGGSAPAAGGAGGAGGSDADGMSGAAGQAATGGSGGSGGFTIDASDSGSGGTGGNPPAPDPKTCAEAAMQKAYLGCDFWPTVTANPVWQVFDFAVVVANVGTDPADVSVEFQGSPIAQETVPPNGLKTIYLPWVFALKGSDADMCGLGSPPSESVRVNGGAFHLTSTRPVTVYQFNPIEYRGQGGPPNKDWSSCPGSQCLAPGVGCFSYSNDASLLIPTTAMTGNYRIAAMHGWRLQPPLQPEERIPAFLTITATEDNTTVKTRVSLTGAILPGPDVAATGAGGLLTLSMNAGDVVQLLSAGLNTSDLGGSLVQADKPVQVITGSSCMQVPTTAAACSHIEESVLPAESLGKRYFVTVPTAPDKSLKGHVVRIFGNVDGTKFSYPSGTPMGAPAIINAGQVADLGLVKTDFEIVGDHEFAVASFIPGGSILQPGIFQSMRQGDPSQTQVVAVEQYRQKYVFIAPTDFATNFVDIIQPLDANLVLDGSPVPIAPVPIGSSMFGVARVPLGNATQGAHLIAGDKPFGIQVLGYGTNTSYHYPGGLALEGIAPPPPPVE